MHLLNIHRIFALVVATGLLMAACSLGGQGTEAAITSPQASLSTQTVMPSATSKPSRVLFVANETADASQVETLRSAFEDLAGSSGFTFESQSSLNSENLDGTVRAAILFGSPQDLSELAAQNLGVDFIVVNAGQSIGGSNVYPLSFAQASADQVAFLAGYMASMATFDWRVGAVALGGTAGSQDLAAFESGVRYFCGWCRPEYPPYYEYPHTLTVSAADAANGAAAASSLRDVGVETVYVPLTLSTTEFLTPLAEAGLSIIAPVEPSSGLEAQWMATIQGDFQAIIRGVWDAMLAGDPAPSEQSAINISYVNQNLISPGRAALVQQAVVELQSGFITTGISEAE